MTQWFKTKNLQLAGFKIDSQRDFMAAQLKVNANLSV